MALTACRTSLTCAFPCRRGRGRPHSSHPVTATTAAPVAVPVRAPVAVPVTASPASVPPMRTSASAVSSPAIVVKRCRPWRMPRHRPLKVIPVSDSATRIAGTGVARCRSAISNGETASPTAVTTPAVVRPSATSSPSPARRATRSAATACMPMAGTAPMTSTASSEPSSPKAAGTSSRAASTLSR